MDGGLERPAAVLVGALTVFFPAAAPLPEDQGAGWPFGHRREGEAPIDRDEREEQRALFRNDLIAPVLHRDLERGEQAEILRQQAAQEWQVPGGGRRRYSERHLRRLLQRRRTGGLDGLLRKRRADAGKRKRLNEAAWQRAATLRREQPRRSAEVILHLLCHEGLLAPGACSPATLRRQLRAAGLNRAALLRDRPKAYRRWQRSDPGALWQFDATGGLWLPDPVGGPPRQLWMIAGKDDASRLLVGARAYHHAHQAALDDLCKRAFRRWGIPRAIYVDRGSIFTSHHFRLVCAELGIELIHATQYYPEGKGFAAYCTSSRRSGTTYENASGSGPKGGTAFSLPAPPGTLSVLGIIEHRPGPAVTIRGAGGPAHEAVRSGRAPHPARPEPRRCGW